MSERGIPDSWSAAKASRPGEGSGIPKLPVQGTSDSNPVDRRRLSKPVVRRDVDLKTPSPKDLKQPLGKKSTASSSPVAGELRSEPPSPIPTPQPKRQGQSKAWVLWILGGLLSCGVGIVGVALLFKLPGLPNCPSIFWPTASASVRLYCAQVAANKQTVKDLLEAIALLRALPSDHPLHQEINSYLQQWSQDILGLAEESFQAGKLDDAIATAKEIPQDVPAHKLVEKRIAQWQGIWAEAEGYYKDAEAEMHQQHWHLAFNAAVHLLNVGNKYWATTKYDELNALIASARDDGNKLAKAQNLAQEGGLNNLLAAINLVKSIGQNSYVYRDAQAAIPEFGRKLLDLAQNTLDRRNADEAIEIARKIPDDTNLKAEVEDFIALAEAQQSAWRGTIADLQGAIAQAQNIAADRPLYNRAQELIVRWQAEIEDVIHLERAREIARGGTVGDLTAAIAEARLVPERNPRTDEASQEIRRWRDQIETIEDAPYLDRAEQLADGGDMNSLQAAIGEASQIAKGRALYREAQQKIRNWSRKIEEIEDQPLLDQARMLASTGNLSAAIATAQEIQPGRALYSLAQATIRDWQGQLRARENWQQAQRLALQQTPDSLGEAIRMAQRVPDSNPLRTDVNEAINQWSQQLLSMAQDRAASDIPSAIQIAKQIPPDADAYKSAQEQIEVWRKSLNPSPQPLRTLEQSTTRN